MGRCGVVGCHTDRPPKVALSLLSLRKLWHAAAFLLRKQSRHRGLSVTQGITHRPGERPQRGKLPSPVTRARPKDLLLGRLGGPRRAQTRAGPPQQPRRSSTRLPRSTWGTVRQQMHLHLPGFTLVGDEGAAAYTPFCSQNILQRESRPCP